MRFDIGDAKDQKGSQVAKVKEDPQLIKNFRLDREAYQKMLKLHKKGDVTYVQIEDQVTSERQRAANAIFVGADYENFEVKNMYKSLNLVKPDVILLQVRPDLVLENNFKYFSEEQREVA